MWKPVIACLVLLIFHSCNAETNPRPTVADPSHLPLDTAAVRIHFICTYAASSLTVTYQPGNCNKCLPQLFDIVSSANASEYRQLRTNFPTTFLYRNSFGGDIQEFRYQFKHDGAYTVDINTAEDQVTVTVDREPVSDVNVPVYILLGCIAGAVGLWNIVSWSIERYKQSQQQASSMMEEQLLYPPDATGNPYGASPLDAAVFPSLPLPAVNSKKTAAPANKERLASLDAFRGLALMLMIFVNYGGGGYWYFNHAEWNGLTVADLLFPWFVWIMGASMALSLDGLKRKGHSGWSLLAKAVRRAVLLFALGLFLNNGADLHNWRIPGVLQRFAVSGLAVAIILIAAPYAKRKTDSLIVDLVAHWWEWAIILVFVLLHLLLTFLVDVPGCGRGYLGPGGIGDNGLYADCPGGAAGYLDRYIFGDSHIFHDPTCRATYNCPSYDPEGFLGTFTSIFLTYLGVQAGRVLVYYSSAAQRTSRWLLWAAVLGSISIGLCGGTQNGGVIPINKNLWSLSFVLAMAAAGFVLLTAMYALIDVFRLWSGAPLVSLGMNSIALYMGHELLSDRFPFTFNTDASDHGMLLLRNVVGVGAWVLIAVYMHSIDFFVKI